MGRVGLTRNPSRPWEKHHHKYASGNTPCRLLEEGKSPSTPLALVFASDFAEAAGLLAVLVLGQCRFAKDETVSVETDGRGGVQGRTRRSTRTVRVWIIRGNDHSHNHPHGVWSCYVDTYCRKIMNSSITVTRLLNKIV